MAKMVWTIDNQQMATSHVIEENNSNKPVNFSLNVVRMKDCCTDLETLKITAYLKGSSMALGTIYIAPADIEAGLADFKRYGVMLSRPECIEIAKVIREGYYCFTSVSCYDGCNITDDMFNDILGILHGLILEKNIKAISVEPRHLAEPCVVYSIPVKLFNAEILSSQFKRITPKAVQEYLDKQGLIIANRGRLDYVATFESEEEKKKVKCVCLIKDNFDAAIK